MGDNHRDDGPEDQPDPQPDVLPAAADPQPNVLPAAAAQDAFSVTGWIDLHPVYTVREYWLYFQRNQKSCRMNWSSYVKWVGYGGVFPPRPPR